MSYVDFQKTKQPILIYFYRLSNKVRFTHKVCVIHSPWLPKKEKILRIFPRFRLYVPSRTIRFLLLEALHFANPSINLMWRQGIELYDEYTRSNIKRMLDPFFHYSLKPFLVPLMSANSLLKTIVLSLFLKRNF